MTPIYINSIAPTPATVVNGKSLVKKGNFSNLKITADKVLLFGECAGSGKKAYFCSMDFIDESNPIPRCNCPSRQFPCKHVIGLLLAYVEGKQFEESDIPDEIATKREGTAKRAENKQKKLTEKRQDVDKPPTKAKITTAIKRFNMQLEGVENAEKILESIIRTGLAGIDARTRDAFQAQVTGLGNYHIKGIQAEFNELFLSMKEQAKNSEYSQSIEQLILLRALLTKAREHLTAKKENSILKLDTSSAIEEQIGHVWKLNELNAYDCYIKDAKIIQLSFNVHNNPAKKEFVDQGLFICMSTGKIYTKKNYRPYKGVKYIVRDDSEFRAVLVEELYIYPGGMNPRIRFDKNTTDEIQPDDYTAIKKLACDDYIEMAKAVKNQIKAPLADKTPVALLSVSQISAYKDSEGNNCVLIEDSKGKGQLLTGSNINLLNLLNLNSLAGQAILVMYENDRNTGLLTARPLSVVTDSQIVRLEY